MFIIPLEVELAVELDVEVEVDVAVPPPVLLDVLAAPPVPPAPPVLLLEVEAMPPVPLELLVVDAPPLPVEPLELLPELALPPAPAAVLELPEDPQLTASRPSVTTDSADDRAGDEERMFISLLRSGGRRGMRTSPVRISRCAVGRDSRTGCVRGEEERPTWSSPFRVLVR
jgi:hypothetical protein